MSLFEIHRLWDVWPNIHNHQVLRDLFRQVSSPSFEAGGQRSEYTIDRIFVVPGHVFVTTVPKQPSQLTTDIIDQSEGHAALYCFSRIPMKEEPKSCDNHVTPYILQLDDKCKRIVNVIDVTVGDVQRIVVIQDCGILSSYEYNTVKFFWELKEEIAFSSQSESLIHDAVLHTSTSSTAHTLTYCEQPHTSHSHTKHSSQVTIRSLVIQPGRVISLGEPRVILAETPPLNLLTFEQGVCFLPSSGPYPKGLLLFWVSESPNELAALVWNSSKFISPSSFMSGHSPMTFRSVTLRLARVWSKVNSGPILVAMETHPLTGQLLALASDGTLFDITINQHGSVKRSHLTRFSDFAQRNPAPSGIFSFPLPYHKVHLFCTHTYYGYCLKGELRIYDSFTGEFVWECDDHEGAGSLLWTTPTPPGFCGVYGNSGVWLIRSHKAADHAQFMATALFPITTNADETTPGDYLDCGQLLAAKLSKLWNLQLLATKYSLEGVFDTVKAHVDETNPTNKQTFLPQLHHEFFGLLSEDSSLQNPALVVALLAEYPEYRQQLNCCIAEFLDRYHSNETTTDDLLTPLNADIVPLLKEYKLLSDEFDRKLDNGLPNDVPSGRDVRGEVCQLLKTSEAATVSDGEVEASSRALLHSLCEMDPSKALLGIRDFFCVDSFEKAVQEFETSSWVSTRNWRGILATEGASRVQRGYMQASTNHLPVFEETCRLLYHTHPSELLHFVTFAQLARDFQTQGESTFARKCRKDFFFHRALNALPMFVSEEATPTSCEAIQARCQLLLRSDYSNVHMSCLQLLLSNKMWSDALTLVEEVKNEETHCALFHCLLVSTSKGGVLHHYLDRLWTLIPKRFSVFDFLGILKTAVGDGRERPLLETEDDTHLTVSSVTSKLLDLLKQTNIRQTEH